ncbi:MAG: EscU/YscU/HrcU family type III secretion system export apparatus switch protein [Planctomycetales bacterium]|nr:EscU/YscU/HrcU family type III secretion system export apparatus switch protein [Planctomycetales bacterium]
MSDSGQSKTEQATPRKREEARKKGQTVQSAELSGAISFFLAALLMWVSADATAGRLKEVMVGELSGMHQLELTVGTARHLALSGAKTLIEIIGPILGCVWLVSLAAGMGQTRGLITFETIKPDVSKFSIFRGWKRVWTVRSLVRFGNVVIRVLVISSLVAWAIYAEVIRSAVPPRTLDVAAAIGCRLALKIVLITATVLLITGIIDFVMEWRKHEADLRMTLQEVREERKDEEVDPHLRARIRRVAQEIRKQSFSRDVPRATAVITNPTHFAVAIRYVAGETPAPVVVAKGADHLAKRIIAIAREHSVPVIERPPLARALFATVEPGHEIPVHFYRVVAEVLAYIARLRQAG